MQHAARVLGVTQKEIENEYYMVDLPDILKVKTKEQAARLFEQIMIRLATNQRFMPDDEYKQFVASIMPNENKAVENQFNREKFEELRMLTNMGVNRKGG
ncbi:hypothetical protein OEV98_10940 [Caldibacillus lycopersici]|uniref:Uncharacterized protein n=1 Tax=Perspicuibacillus lycopersici TaxID=1325689 RepID=A0AAE3IT13_9BACI|nr:hypothetical protein [Perspicuibacillus lycopersici]MCU9614075.1 hypothetical protein [Perspicuibacillus lycopersici]